MARVPLLNPSDLSEADRPLLYPGPVYRLEPRHAGSAAANADKAKSPANIYRALAHSPDLLRHWSVFGRWLGDGCQLDPRLRELVTLQVGYLTATPYQWTHHVKSGRNAGVTDADIRAVMAATAGESHKLDEVETLVLTAAREITTERRMGEDTWDKLLAHLGRARLIDLTVVIAHVNSVARILGTLGIEPEPDYESVLKEFPLPA